MTLGLHSLTGGRKVIDIIHKLGHCMSYNLTSEIETAQAESSLLAATQTTLLPLVPATPSNTVFTHFWADNFDMNIERMVGGGSINTTHLMAFQEWSHGATTNTEGIIIPKNKSRKPFYEDIAIQAKPVDKKREPIAVRANSMSQVTQSNDAEKLFNSCFFLWTFIRKQHAFDQIVPICKGWMTQIRNVQQNTIQKTTETFLAPITSKVTDFHTIQKYLSYLQNLARSVNMTYVNITLDVGAAINAYKTIWNYPVEYANIIIHLGSFHFIKEYFQVKLDIYNYCI